METQVLRNSGESVRVTFTLDGVPTDADSGVTVTVTADDGTVIVTSAATSRISAGLYAYSLAPRPDLDHLTLVWSGLFSGVAQSVTTYVDIVGGYYISLAELRATKNLSDTDKYTTAELIEARQWFETTFERYTGRAFVPRYKRLVAWGAGANYMVLPDEYLRRLRTVRFGDVNLSVAALANIALESSGRIQHFWPLGINGPDDSFGIYGSSFPLNARITLAYEYGLDQAPGDVVDAARIAIRDKLLTDNAGSRVLSSTTELGGIVRTSYPGPDRPFGIPYVDRVANDRRRPGRRGDVMTVGTVGIS